MDEARFDALTRRWETTLRSRRTLVRLLASSGLVPVLGQIIPLDRAEADADKRTHRRRSRPHTAIADTGSRVIGLACRMAQPKGPVHGEPCSKRRAVAKHHPPHGCCPGSSCLSGSPLTPVTGKKSGWCFCDDGTEPDPEHQGFCRTIPPPQCLLDSQACTASDQCCQLSGLWCAINDGPTTGTPGQPDFYCGYECAVVMRDKPDGPCLTHGQALVANCCRAEGFSCDDDCSCCGDLRCRQVTPNHYQCDPPLDTCQPVGDRCDDGEPCCAGAGRCQDGRCCLPDSAVCPRFCQPGEDCPTCCAGTCRADGRCGPVQGCTDYGGVCSSSAECCNAVPCTDGRCRYT